MCKLAGPTQEGLAPGVLPRLKESLSPPERSRDKPGVAVCPWLSPASPWHNLGVGGNVVGAQLSSTDPLDPASEPLLYPESWV